MKIVKTTAIVSLLAMLCASNANAWGKKEQGFLLGAAAVLTLPHLLGSHRYNEPVRYNDDRHHYPPNVSYTRPSAPTIIYIENVKNGDNILPHRKVKPHNYIHNKPVNHINKPKVIITHR